jgi:hypothetical protein
VFLAKVKGNFKEQDAAKCENKNPEYFFVYWNFCVVTF